uniref:Uncharacterized protein n=1 Tax=Sphaerodactylus townsendi TaxID=933632 RepID=A0ACB8GAX9_9SAUR
MDLALRPVELPPASASQESVRRGGRLGAGTAGGPEGPPYGRRDLSHATGGQSAQHLSLEDPSENGSSIVVLLQSDLCDWQMFCVLCGTFHELERSVPVP